MSTKKYGKGRPGNNQTSFRMNEKVAEGPPVELENQFILRLPEEPASALREAIKSGASNLKERLFIQLEPDKGSNTQYLRKGHVQVSWEKTRSDLNLICIPQIWQMIKLIWTCFDCILFSLTAGTAPPGCWTCQLLLSLTRR